LLQTALKACKLLTQSNDFQTLLTLRRLSNQLPKISFEGGPLMAGLLQCV
jgi:hypothetical protein